MLYRRRRFLAFAVAVGVFVASLCVQYGFDVQSDFSIPHCGAQKLLAGEDPYTCPTGGMASNPLTTVLFFVPLAWMPIQFASATVMALSVAFLSLALNKPGEPWRLLVLLSVPFVYSVQISQWAPLLLAIALSGKLYPLIVVKPHVAMSVAISRATPRGVAVVCLILLATFFVWPDWLPRWLFQTRGYDGFVPALSLAGAVLLLAALRIKNEAARWLLLLSLTPQRTWYDQLLLFVIPRSAKQMLVVWVASWIMWFPEIFGWGHSGYNWVTLSMFYPVLGIVLLDGSHPLTWLASLGARMGLFSGGSHVGFVRKLLGMAEGRALSIKD